MDQVKQEITKRYVQYKIIQDASFTSSMRGHEKEQVINDRNDKKILGSPRRSLEIR